jgi:hypothetical protein
VCDVMLQAVRLAADNRPQLAAPIIRGIIEGSGNERMFVRKIVAELPIALSDTAVGSLVAMIGKRLTTVLKG